MKVAIYFSDDCGIAAKHTPREIFHGHVWPSRNLRAMNNQDVRPLFDKSADNEIASEPTTQASFGLKLLIVVDQQEFTRGCLNSWIKTFCREFHLFSIADVTISASATTLAQATMVIFHVNNLALADNWLDSQVAWLRANRPDVPIVAIVEPDAVRPVAELVNRFRLQGYIPTSSSMEVAAAVLHLVAAGGTYIPHNKDESPPRVVINQIQQTSQAMRTTGLTPREFCVLELLERGMSNKIIAYRLSLSQSTVKAHVHNIISKLKVHNRTEAAMASHHLQQTFACANSR